jgi:hypothetical protein
MRTVDDQVVDPSSVLPGADMQLTVGQDARRNRVLLVCSFVGHDQYGGVSLPGAQEVVALARIGDVHHAWQAHGLKTYDAAPILLAFVHLPDVIGLRVSVQFQARP